MKKKKQRLNKIVVPIIWNIDIDGTLARGVSWKSIEAKKAKIDKGMVAAINEASKTGMIVIHTARRKHMLLATLEWLDANNVYWDAFARYKSPGKYVDDSAVTPTQFKKIYLKNKNVIRRK